MKTVYMTKAGIVGAEIHIDLAKDSYRWSGKWGAGSGYGVAEFAKRFSETLASKRGAHLESGPAIETYFRKGNPTMRKSASKVYTVDGYTIERKAMAHGPALWIVSKNGRVTYKGDTLKDAKNWIATGYNPRTGFTERKTNPVHRYAVTAYPGKGRWTFSTLAEARKAADDIATEKPGHHVMVIDIANDRQIGQGVARKSNPTNHSGNLDGLTAAEKHYREELIAEGKWKNPRPETVKEAYAAHVRLTHKRAARAKNPSNVRRISHVSRYVIAVMKKGTTRPIGFWSVGNEWDTEKAKAKRYTTPEGAHKKAETLNVGAGYQIAVMSVPHRGN